MTELPKTEKRRTFSLRLLMISGFGLILCAVPFVLKDRLRSWIKIKAERHDIGKKELLLVGLSLVVTLIASDFALSLILVSEYLLISDFPSPKRPPLYPRASFFKPPI